MRLNCRSSGAVTSGGKVLRRGCALLAAPALVLLAAGAPARAADAPALVADRARFEAQVKGDRAALEKLIAPELTYVHSSGAVESRDEFLAGLESKKYVYKTIASEDVTVRTFGDTAVIVGKAAIDVAVDGKDLHVVVRFTDVWVKRDGRWQMVAWHSARLNP